jgi:hypothetical protein
MPDGVCFAVRISDSNFSRQAGSSALYENSDFPMLCRSGVKSGET